MDDDTLSLPLKPLGYFKATRTATYSFLAALPLLFAYEVLIVAANPSGGAAIRVGADLWIKDLIAALGVQSHMTFGAVALLLGTGLFIAERRKKVSIRAWYFVGIVVESFVYSIVVAVLVSRLVARIVSGGPMLAAVPLADSPMMGDNLLLKLALSLGAGLYEEMFFRLFLVTGLFMVARIVIPFRVVAYAMSAFVGAVLFSAVHYIGMYGDSFEWQTFLFRLFMGLALNALFLLRGFGIAAWTHALYDVFVVTIAH